MKRALLALALLLCCTGVASAYVNYQPNGGATTPAPAGTYTGTVTASSNGNNTIYTITTSAGVLVITGTDPSLDADERKRLDNGEGKPPPHNKVEVKIQPDGVVDTVNTAN